MNLFERLRDSLRKTSGKLTADIKRIVGRTPKLDEDALEELEATLIAADLGVATVRGIIERVRDTRDPDVLTLARDEIERELLVEHTETPALLNQAAAPPTVVLLAGVNGAGKTTSTGKLAHYLKQRDNSVLLAACDTFRAAAIEQLKLWGQRVGCDVIAGQYGADSAAIAFDALDAAIKRNADYLLIDTAGRLHTKRNLMEEIKKMQRSLQKRLPAAPHEVLLVLDATTGNNALTQAREFHQALGITGLILTKLDGTAKGGIVVAIARELKLPLKFIAVGEEPEDLQPFDVKTFVDALFGA